MPFCNEGWIRIELTSRADVGDIIRHESGRLRDDCGVNQTECCQMVMFLIINFRTSKGGG